MTNALNRGTILPGLAANVITSEPDLASPIRPPHNAGVTVMRVAIAEADASLANLLNHYLRRSGHHIWQQLWGRREAVSSRTLDTQVSRIRHKLGFIPENGWSLDAKYSHGYRLRKVDATPRVSSAARLIRGRGVTTDQAALPVGGLNV
jgi:hypothetical protein